MLFGVYGNFGVVVLGVWKLGILAHTKLSVCIRDIAKLRGFCGYGETWSAFGGGWARSVVASCRSVVGCGRSVVIFFSAFRETR